VNISHSDKKQGGLIHFSIHTKTGPYNMKGIHSVELAIVFTKAQSKLQSRRTMHYLINECTQIISHNILTYWHKHTTKEIHLAVTFPLLLK